MGMAGRTSIYLATSLIATSLTLGVFTFAKDEAPKDAGKEPSRDPGLAPIPADPPPLTERDQWVFDLKWERGDVTLISVRKRRTAAPQTTARSMGRFALELYEGPGLVERVRFEFPLLGGERPDAGSGMRSLPDFEGKLSTRAAVLFPVTMRGTRLELWDRATDKRWPLPWPPMSPNEGTTVKP